MFEINDVPGEEILKAILACQENENPCVTVIEATGLSITPLPPKIPLEKEHEWMESKKKSPTAWRTETDNGFHLIKIKK